ncbi:unnamed protein product [Brugia timori]|uniref:Uncharacterized protein n=1 Tax=Brugia timori TaxID=42155 RepID=A0A3P7SR41_9BILA|nr:unnamed protein product [Brugia timori]
MEVPRIEHTHLIYKNNKTDHIIDQTCFFVIARTFVRNTTKSNDSLQPAWKSKTKFAKRIPMRIQKDCRMNVCQKVSFCGYKIIV